MTYSPPHGSYPSYPMRYALQQPHHNQHQHQRQIPPSQHPSAQPSHSRHTPPTHDPKPPYAHNPHLRHTQVPIKLEESPDLPPVSALSNYDHHVNPSSAPTSASASANHIPSLFRFGASDFSASASPTSSSPTAFTFMSHQPWPSAAPGSSSYAAQSQYAAGIDRYPLPSPVSSANGSGHHHPLALADDYDDDGADDLADLPGAGLGGMGLASYGASGVGGKSAAEKQVRRRSSKACDQCRKSKCKCERTSPQEPCRNCVMLGTQCTFLGPSRKRGPPKGYIDAIEARLHQTEALIGILLSSKDSRAKSMLEDLAEDPLAKEIISRVDNSPYGFKGRSRGAEAPTSRARTSAPEQRETGGNEGNVVHAAHPSNEWQDRVISRLNAAAADRETLLPEGQVASTVEEGDEETSRPASTSASAAARQAADSQAANGDARRQRRRLDEGTDLEISRRSTSSASSRSPLRRNPEESMEETEESGEDEMALAIGQLSLNEDEQVRFHGKMSGLHLLGVKERKDGHLHEGGIWRFPTSRVWPPLPPSARSSKKQFEDSASRLPDIATQELLVELYFTYVHPALPIVHKSTFMEDFRKGHLSADSPYSGESTYSDAASPVSTSSQNRRGRHVPTLLLLAMFSLAARYSSRTGVAPPDDGQMWTAGDEYMGDAKVILDRTYAASRPSTCQALLLLGYREVGIGAMAQAWLYVGMAVRMAQDLGLHKSAEEWTSVGGRSLFSRAELQERRRIWYGCVVMDKYVCTYIGRPVAITERDFDTELPGIEEGEEAELWRPHPSPPVLDDVDGIHAEITPAPGHILSCFNESAKLSLVLSEICQNIYAIKPPGNRPVELARLDKQLTKWSLELPEHLRFDPASPKNPPPPPHILTLHMQYWCTVLLLHRPFLASIRHIPDASKPVSPSALSAREAEIRANSRQHYDMCAQAANHIAHIVSVYADYYCPRRASVFLCYYVFTAAVMHVATLRMYPDDPQGQRGLDKCLDMLKRMSVLWPSAWRALELFAGVKAQLERPSEVPSLRSLVSEPRHKRAAEDPVDVQGVTVTERSRAVAQDHAYRQPANAPYPVVSNASQGQGQGQSSHGPLPPSHAQQSYSLSLDMPQGSGSYIQQPSYDRWAADSSALSSFPASISTSVLPQTYSTGLVDERMGSGLGRGSDRQSQRYPQYWNDYSALGQMEANYSMPVNMGDMVSHHHAGAHHPAAPGEHHGHHQPMYVPDQYNTIFGNMPPSNQQ